MSPETSRENERPSKRRKVELRLLPCPAEEHLPPRSWTERTGRLRT